MAGRLLLLGDVVEAADEMADLVLLILDATDHEPYWEEMAIPVQALLLAEPVSLLIDGDDDLLLQAVAIIGRPQGLDMLTEHLLARKAGDAAEGVIDLEDDAAVVHHQQTVVGVEGHLGQAQGIVVGEALQFDGRPFTLFVEGIEQGNGVGQRPVQQQGDLAQGGAALTL